ncbi:MAG: S8 family serine peptidase [Planctomycetota bacterium]|nr:S8 family serine peptidase [Planctomycetota bacterium]
MLSSIALLALVPLVPSTPAAGSEKILPELRAAIAERPADERYRVYAVLDERMTIEDFAGVGALRRGERQLFVAAILRDFADATQGDVLALLDELESQGEVERVQQLWIANSVIFHGTKRAIEAVAALPEVERIGWDPVRPDAEYWDATPPTPTGGGFTTYYSQGFEGGTLPAEFATSTTGCGSVIVTGLYGPKTGSFHMVMASTTDICDGTATATLTVDLTGVTTAGLRYAFKDMNDEFDPGLDVLEASDDGGATWTKIADLTGSTTYLTKTHDLDPLGLTYGAGFQIRWRWKDNYTPETDGFGIDDIEIADGFPPPPPPNPEPNLVQLQAPDLWAVGITGQGAVLLNIDSGVDCLHPDLAGRIWSNPLDPVDGIDNDGNGYVDDHLGWDFVGGDNDPCSGASHGTSTSGIMVGDGSAGIAITGMAPGASLAVARISGETQHWLAQQWGISVAVDCSSSSHSYKWSFSPKPDYHMHRQVQDMILVAGIIHTNSIGNQGGDPSHPVPFNISAPGLAPSPWRHFEQTQSLGGVSGVMACGAIELSDTAYSFSGTGPSAWEDIQIYDGSYPHPQSPGFWDYPYGGFGGGLQALLKPDVVTYTNVQTTTPGGGYGSFGGTSASTPHLGGALALMVSVNGHAEPRHISQALQITAVDMGPPGKDSQFGAGRIQVRDAALRLLHLVKVDDQDPGLGQTVNLHVSGFPGDFFTVLYSTSVGQTLTPFGTLDLGSPFFILFAGNLDATGEFTQAVVIPNNPALVGTTFHLQSAVLSAAGATGLILFSVVESLVVGP